MTCYRLAVQDRYIVRWSWKTTPITSLKAMFELLRCYRALLPQDRIRICTASSKEELNEQLSRENNGLASGSITALARWVGLPKTMESHPSTLCIGPTWPTSILMKTAL